MVIRVCLKNDAFKITIYFKRGKIEVNLYFEGRLFPDYEFTQG